MNGKDLMEALSFVDEAYIAQADTAGRRKTVRWRSIAAMAACFCLIIFAIRLWQPEKTANELNMMQSAAPAVTEAQTAAPEAALFSARIMPEEAAAEDFESQASNSLKDGIEQSAAPTVNNAFASGATASRYSADTAAGVAAAQITVRVETWQEGVLTCTVVEDGYFPEGELLYIAAEEEFTPGQLLMVFFQPEDVQTEVLQPLELQIIEE